MGSTMIIQSKTLWIITTFKTLQIRQPLDHGTTVLQQLNQLLKQRKVTARYSKKEKKNKK